MTSVAVAAPHGDAVSAAEDAVRAGGNALDAALAAAAVLAVSYPHQCSLGGDLTALVRRPDGTVSAVLSLGAAAAGLDPELVANGNAMPRQGPLTVTVPGVVAGWIALAEAGARLGLAQPLRRAAALAKGGFPIPAGLERAIDLRLEAVLADPGLRALLAPEGRPLRAGDRLIQPELARTLEALADDPDSYYRGDLAQALARGLAELGSPITTDDLAAHHPEQAEPLALDTSAGRWWAPPPPAQGATALALIRDDDERDPLTRVRSANAARDRGLGDPRGGPIDVDAMLAPQGAATVAAAPRAAGDTVAIAALDSDGLAVVLVQSVFQTFGAGLLERATGIVLHNRGAAFTVGDPTHPGRLAPGRRPPHTLCPLIGETPHALVAVGCQGGRAQPQILAQVAAGLSDPAREAGEVLAAPRWVLGGRDLDLTEESVLFEPGASVPPSPEIPTVPASGPDDRCGHVQVARALGARLEAAADPRADGHGVVLTGG